MAIARDKYIEFPQDYLHLEYRRQDAMRDLYAHLKSYDLPKGWHVLVAPSSISLTSPKRSRIIKIDCCFTVMIDKIKAGTVKSNVHRMSSSIEAWQIVEASLNAFKKANP